MTVTQLTPPGRYPPMTERNLQDQHVIPLCKWLGLLAYHTHDSRRSAGGFPDLVIVGTRVLYRELKSASGVLSRDQAAWRDALQEAGQDWDVWDPADWYSGRIRRELEAIMHKART